MLSILAPGSILFYFSIQNIVSQKQLTEKRLLEEQNELATELAEYFQLQLLECASTFFNRVDSLASELRENISLLDSISGVTQVFIVDKKGEFIWPHFLDETQLKPRYHRSREFLQSFAEAEKSEFATSDLKKARQLYKTALKVTTNKSERATATNGLARVLVKQGLTKLALDQYRILSNRYGSVADDSGLPFAYYALHQLIKLTSHKTSELILEDIETILSRLLNGQIPLTDHTELLLQEVLNWFAETDETISQANNVYQKIEAIRKLFSFVLQEGSHLKQYLSGRDGTISSTKLGDFEAIVGNSENQPTLHLLNRKSNSSELVGFKVNLVSLRNKVLGYVPLKKTSLDLEVAIVPRAKATQIMRNPSTTIKELSPVVPLWLLWISPNDPEIINRYISKRRWVYGIALAFLIAGMSFGIVLVLRDVSREQRLARLRTDFVSNVSHELKTPLTSIRMLAETMRLGRIKKKGEVQEYLSMIVNESERLSRLINNVLDFSKIDQGKKRYHLGPTNLSEVMKSVISVMENSISEKGFELKSDIAPNVQTVADADALEQAVLNLLSNAAKYSQARKEIFVRLWTDEEWIYIRVADKGIGIPESEQKHIFEKFYRGGIEHKHDISGTGLGLTVVKYVVDAHDGKIELESEVGEGSRFTIILPKRQKHKRQEG